MTDSFAVVIQLQIGSLVQTSRSEDFVPFTSFLCIHGYDPMRTLRSSIGQHLELLESSQITTWTSTTSNGPTGYISLSEVRQINDWFRPSRLQLYFICLIPTPCVDMQLPGRYGTKNENANILKVWPSFPHVDIGALLIVRKYPFRFPIFHSGMTWNGPWSSVNNWSPSKWWLRSTTLQAKVLVYTLTVDFEDYIYEKNSLMRGEEGNLFP